MTPKIEPNTALAWVAIAPLTLAVTTFYVVGWHAIAPQLILVLGALTISAELLKWVILEMAERRFREGFPLRGAALSLAALGCLAWGVASGMVALQSLTLPAERYAAAAARVADLEAKIDALPVARPDMPAARIAAMSADVERRRTDLNARLATARQALAETPKPAGAAPHVPVWAKALVAFLIEAILFGVPFALRTPERPETKPATTTNAASELARRRWGTPKAA